MRRLRGLPRRPERSSLRAAYEFGREAVSRRLSVLDLAVAHQEALLSACVGGLDSAETRRSGARPASSSSRACRPSRWSSGASRRPGRPLLERRQTEMSRRLSTFLADASLALDASDSLEEMLRLVAEQARELVGAECCVATVAFDGEARSAEAASYSDQDGGGPRSSGGSTCSRSTESSVTAAGR